jgi:beta-lactam-binding protein with PASTA domain
MRRTDQRMPESNNPIETQPPNRFVSLGKFLLLVTILAAVGSFSAIVGIRLAVRGDEIRVPSLIGKTVIEAKEELSAIALTLEVTGHRYDATVPEGGIVSQLPVAGGQMKQSRAVQVIVSQGDRRNPVPNLLGSSLRSARMMVASAGYEIATVSSISLPGVEREEVIQQYPTPESKEVVSSKIDVLVARPSSVRFLMPDLTGKNIAVVTAFLERGGFKVTSPVYRSYRNADRGIVVKQYPEPGYVINAGDPVSLEVAR